MSGFMSKIGNLQADTEEKTKRATRRRPGSEKVDKIQDNFNV